MGLDSWKEKQLPWNRHSADCWQTCIFEIFELGVINLRYVYVGRPVFRRYIRPRLRHVCIRLWLHVLDRVLWQVCANINTGHVTLPSTIKLV